MPRVAVQHHHAHVASCLAEHGLQGPALGVAFDGTGVGPDGALWGGELLLADLIGFRRLAHLQPIALLGGEAAIREPWRLAVAALAAAGEPVDCVAVEAAPLRRVCALLERRVGCPESTGAGRWFDAVAALCGLRTHTSYEGQAAIELEAAAAPECRGPYEFHLDGTVVELRTMIRAIAADVRLGVPVGEISARFHETLAHAIWAVCRRERGPDLVVLSGGCFQNRRLSERTQALLEQDGFRVLQQCRVPAGDGGLSLGQAAIAMARGGLSCA
jgi:hydrogenase maturation protein HypF